MVYLKHSNPRDYLNIIPKSGGAPFASTKKGGHTFVWAYASNPPPCFFLRLAGVRTQYRKGVVTLKYLRTATHNRRKV